MKKINKHTGILLFIMFFFNPIAGYSQKQDTIAIDASNIDTKALIPGVHRYLVYFKMGKDNSRTRYQLWSRTVDFITYQEKEAISITQVWEDNDTIVHTAYSILTKKDFATLYHKTWWKRPVSFEFDFINKQISKDGIQLKESKDSITNKRVKAFETACPQYFLNWHLDLEVFSLLPYKKETTFKINFYDPGFDDPRYEYYSITGSGILTGYNNQKIDCWLLAHGRLPENYEVFWVSKQTKEVLKLEQEYSGKFRYKIKLSHSN